MALPINIEVLIKGKVIEWERLEFKAEATRFYNYPFEALEEAVANAVYHKSYELEKPIEILSYSDPVPPVTAKILKEQKRIVLRDYRNKRIGDFLKVLHLTEGRSTGFPLIYNKMEQNGSQSPVFETDEQAYYFLTVLFNHPDFIEIWKQDNKQGNEDIIPQVTPQVEKLLMVIEGEKTRQEIQELLGLSDMKNINDNYIQPAIKIGLVEVTIPEKPNSSKQRYRMTEEGKRLKEQL
jgi:ATP-dependent DNA helicase RecG